MGKRILRRMAVGFSASTLVTMLVQLIMALQGSAVVTPLFAARFPNEAAAILAQLGLVGVIGMAFAAAAQILEIEKWSFLQQGIVHFVVTAAVWMPIAWFCWMPMPAYALWISIAGWTLTYAVNWLVKYFVWRREVREVNRSIRKYREERKHESD